MANGSSLAVWVQLVYERLVELGLWKYVLPWLLVFFLVYGILQKINLFGNSSDTGTSEWPSGGPHKINVIVAFAVASLIVAFVPFQTGQFAAFVSAYFGSVSVFLIILLGLILFVGMLTGHSTHTYFDDNTSEIKWAMLVGGLIVIFLALASGGFGLLFPGTGAQAGAQVSSGIAQIFLNPTTAAILIILGLILVAIILAGMGGDDSSSS